MRLLQADIYVHGDKGASVVYDCRNRRDTRKSTLKSKLMTTTSILWRIYIKKWTLKYFKRSELSVSVDLIYYDLVGTLGIYQVLLSNKCGLMSLMSMVKWVLSEEEYKDK